MVEVSRCLLEKEGRLQYAVCRNRGLMVRKGNVDTAKESYFDSTVERRLSSRFLLSKPSLNKPRDSDTMSCFQHLLEQTTRDSDSASGLTTGKTSAGLVQRLDDPERGIKIFTIETNHSSRSRSDSSSMVLLISFLLQIACAQRSCPSMSP